MAGYKFLGCFVIEPSGIIDVRSTSTPAFFQRITAYHDGTKFTLRISIPYTHHEAMLFTFHASAGEGHNIYTQPEPQSHSQKFHQELEPYRHPSCTTEAEIGV